MQRTMAMKSLYWQGLDDPNRWSSATVDIAADSLTAHGESWTREYELTWQLSTVGNWVTDRLEVRVVGLGSYKRSLNRSLFLRRSQSGVWSSQTVRSEAAQSGTLRSEAAQTGTSRAEPLQAETMQPETLQSEILQRQTSRREISRPEKPLVAGYSPFSDLPAPGIVEPAGLAGALDCDLGFCPLTNTMPIRRLGLHDSVAAPERELVMAWVEVPSLRVLASRQAYAKLPEDADRVQYRSVGTDFVTQLGVDSDGLVLNYPGMARQASRLAVGA